MGQKRHSLVVHGFQMTAGFIFFFIHSIQWKVHINKGLNLFAYLLAKSWIEFLVDKNAKIICLTYHCINKYSMEFSKWDHLPLVSFLRAQFYCFMAFQIPKFFSGNYIFVIYWIWHWCWAWLSWPKIVVSHDKLCRLTNKCYWNTQLC